MTTDVFKFLSLRAANTPQPAITQVKFIRDDFWSPDFTTHKLVRKERFIGSGPFEELQLQSETGKLVFDIIFDPANIMREVNDINTGIFQELLRVRFTGNPISPASTTPVSLYDLEKTPYSIINGLYYSFPESPAGWKIPAADSLNELMGLIEDALKNSNFSGENLIAEMEQVVGMSLPVFVFCEVPVPGNSTGDDDFLATYNADIRVNLYSPAFAELKARLFEALYALYIVRRTVSVNLELLMNAIKCLHVVEQLAIDAYIGNPSRLAPGLKAVLRTITQTMKLQQPLIRHKKDLQNYTDSTPVIHPIFARLARYKSPFNDIKPIGIGDLKVVKQKLLGYKLGEIASIHNVMKGEQSEKSNRVLNKSEDKVVFSSEDSQFTEKENQLTDKYEMKREADRVIKSDLQVNANAGANFTYGGGAIVANISAGMSYHTSSEDAQKLASNFARDVMEKALSRVESKVSQQRSSSRITETEDIDKHTFMNSGQGAAHISGIFRWVDKQYRSQVYNYGKRLMFEFVVPEPAAFFIQSRIKAYEFYDLKIPEKPVYEPYAVDLKKEDGTALVPTDINSPAVFNALKLKYDLSEFQYPEEKRVVSFKDTNSGKKTLQKEVGVAGDDKMTAEQYELEIPDKGYIIERALTRGAIKYFQLNDNTDNADHSGLGSNLLAVEINGVPVGSSTDNREFLPIGFDTGSLNIPIYDGRITVDVLAQDLDWYTLSLTLFLTLDTRYLTDWQINVFRKIMSIEEKRVAALNDELYSTYKLKLGEYENQKRELEARAINDLIQGKSEAYNRDIILKELKKHCITFLAKEFDTDSWDDLISNKEALGKRSFKQFPVTQFVYDDSAAQVKAGFEERTKEEVSYPVVNIKAAREKGSLVQFLEQAFEWQQLAYMFYPYFWAEEKKWISLMSHLDYTDKNMSDFLQAGSVRVLLAVQPSYNHAVLHYLATREPWEGGNVPVIGDPLYLPLFEEIHKQQDDLHGAKKEGIPWEFTVPTSLIYLHGSTDQLPDDDAFDQD